MCRLKVGRNLTVGSMFPFQTRKLSIGGMRKRTKSETECEEYVCPMDTEVPAPLQKIFTPRTRKAEDVQQGLMINQKSKTRRDEQQVSETMNAT